MMLDRKSLAALILWHSGQFDTFEIAQMLDLAENEVCRAVQLSHDVVRQEKRGKS